MRNIKLTIEYDGTQFQGWQMQANGHRTVQSELEKALSKILKKRTIVCGSGRTDSGVHALGQVANFKANSTLSCAELLKALNANVSKDISIRKVEDVHKDFHARFKAKSKTYRYTILNRVARSAHEKNFCYHYPYRLNLAAMREEAKSLIGRKDFKSFQAADAAKRAQKENNTMRKVTRLDIKKRGDFILIEVEANGFLYKMVRNIVGTLLKVGRNQLPKGSIKTVLKARDRTQAGDTAKAHGLCLMEVRY